jgi:predicted nucleic acid-binding protein
METYKLSHGIEIPDALIAATALYKNYELYTYNIKDYKFIHKLKLYKY